jgi:hypothetical protein
VRARAVAHHHPDRQRERRADRAEPRDRRAPADAGDGERERRLAEHRADHAERLRQTREQREARLRQALPGAR